MPKRRSTATRIFPGQPIRRSRPDDSSTPYLLVNVKVNGAPVTYRGDLKNLAGLYDLERNKVYRIKTVVGEPKGYCICV